MEKAIKIKNEYDSLDKVHNFLKGASTFETSKEYDIWEMRTDTNGQMEQCIVLKKSNMHAIKLHFTDENTLKASHIIPNKMMNAYFGKSVKLRKSIIEIVANKVKDIILTPIQEKAFNELLVDVKGIAI